MHPIKRVKLWFRRRAAQQAREQAVADGDYYVELVVWDGAGKRFGGQGALPPDFLETGLVEMSRSAAAVPKDPKLWQRLGWTRPVKRDRLGDETEPVY